jgi:hypothetical protein
MNWRLDNPPTIDVSVSRHMGLFAVARLAERHRVRVRLRPALPQGLSALVWLPDSAIERSGGFGGGTSNWSAQPVGARTRAMAGAAETAAPALTSGGGGAVGLASDYGNRTSDYGNGNGNGAAEGRTALGWFRGDEDGASRPLTAGALGGQDGGFSFGEPSISDQTVAGLPVRVPRANMPPGAGGSGGSGPGAPDGPAPGAPDGPAPSAQGGLPTRTPGGGRPAGTSHGTANGGSALPQRSPEQVRSRLAGFQRGSRRAEGQGGSGRQEPRPGEGTER